MLHKSPLFPGCEDVPVNTQKGCFSQKITEYIGENYNTDIAKENGLTGRQHINVVFKINQEGNVVDIRSRAPHPALEEEAKRVINLLPKMIPGEHNGKEVNVPYSLPIIFEVAETTDND